MDTSEQYIKMCKKAIEIQKLWKPATGDFYGWTIYESTGHKIWQDGNKINVVADIWLPRQDQFQEILYSNVKIYIQEIVRFYFGNQPVNYYNIQFPEYNFETMEQLLLTLIMKLKYNKTWNGEEWLEEEKNCQQD
jgi:hypothetical protein